MASELASRKYKTTLIDASSFMGQWRPEDIEGPFGFFHVDQMLPSQVSRLIEEDYNDLVSEGFVVWPEDGPVEFASPLIEHHQKAKRWLGDIDHWLKSQIESRDGQVAREKRILDRPFSETWITHLSHQLSSSVFRPNHIGITQGHPLPLYSPYNIRRVSARGLEQSYQWLEKKGVDVLTKAYLQDLWIEKKQVLGVEVKSAWSGVMRSKVVIWCLTSEETQFLNPQLTATLFPHGPLKSQWSWVRMQVDFSGVDEYNIVPLKVVVLGDKNLPWTHENMLVLQKTTDANIADVWLRIPSQFRFQRSYLEDCGNKTKDMLNARFLSDKIAVKNLPIEHRIEESELGPSRHPIYDFDAKKSHRKQNFKNLFYDGPETWENLDWICRFNSDQDLIDSFFEEKNKKLLESPPAIQTSEQA
jgi:hypothetical protein